MTAKTLTLFTVPLVLVGAGWFFVQSTRPSDDVARREITDATGPAEDLAPVDPGSEVKRTVAAGVEKTAVAGGDSEAPRAAHPLAPTFDVIEGRVVDKRTGEPVPAIGVTVTWPALEQNGTQPAHSFITDAQGAFRGTGVDLVGGDVRVRLQDDHGGFGARSTEAVVPFPFVDALVADVGPTYRFAAGAPSSPRAGESVLFAPRTARERMVPLDTVVRTGEEPWVRFAAEALAREGDGPWWLEYRDLEGLRAGRAQVRSIEGIQVEPVLFELDARGVVAFSLEGRDIEAARVDLWPLADATEAQRIFLGPKGPSKTLSGRALHLLPGVYSWRFGAGEGGAGGVVEVVAGKVTGVLIDPHQVGGTFETKVQLLLEVVGDIDPTQWRFMVTLESDPSTGFLTAPRQEQGEAPRTWSLDLRGLVDGRWRVTPDLGPGLKAVPASVTFGPGDPPPRLRIISED